MRTTVDLDDDVAAAVASLRSEGHKGVSEIVNELVRRGLNTPERRQEFTQTSSSMGRPRIDIDNIGEVLDVLEGDGRSG